MVNNKSYYWRKFNDKIGGGQEITEVTEDEKNRIRERKKAAYENIGKMRVPYKKVGQFPKYLMPCEGWDFQRFTVTIQENQKCWTT